MPTPTPNAAGNLWPQTNPNAAYHLYALPSANAGDTLTAEWKGPGRLALRIYSRAGVLLTAATYEGAINTSWLFGASARYALALRLPADVADAVLVVRNSMKEGSLIPYSVTNGGPGAASVLWPSLSAPNLYPDRPTVQGRRVSFTARSLGGLLPVPECRLDVADGHNERRLSPTFPTGPVAVGSKVGPFEFNLPEGANPSRLLMVASCTAFGETAVTRAAYTVG